MSDTERLIEEAGRLCEHATPGPWTASSTGIKAHDGAHTVVYALDGYEVESSDAAFIARARTLVPNLVTALRAERERAEFLRRCWEKAEQAYSGMFRVAVFAIIIGLMIVIGLAFARAQP